jgi:hypothetical protein
MKNPRRDPMKTKLLAATVIALVPLAALAAEPTKTPDPATPAGQSGSFDTLDANKDGRIRCPRPPQIRSWSNRSRPQTER